MLYRPCIMSEEKIHSEIAHTEIIPLRCLPGTLLNVD
jgi:hypothetical protein